MALLLTGYSSSSKNPLGIHLASLVGWLAEPYRLRILEVGAQPHFLVAGSGVVH